MVQGNFYAFCAQAHERTPPQVHRTRMTRIGRIFTDNFDLCASASSVQSVFYRNPATIDDDKKPQMNADERRYVPVTYLIKTTHRKVSHELWFIDHDEMSFIPGRKERKAMKQESLRPLRSLRLNIFFIPAHGRAPPAVHSRSSRAGG